MDKEKQEEIMTLGKTTLEKFIETRKLLSTARSFGTLDIMGVFKWY